MATLIGRLSFDLTGQFGSRVQPSELATDRSFFLAWPIRQTGSGESPSLLAQEHRFFTQPWCCDVRLLAVKDR